jgi:N6-adenosine-specific RNA methylase IME4
MIIPSLDDVPSGRYECIYADPSWPYNQHGRGAAENHYDEMSIEQICDLPVKRIAHKNAFCFCWATPPNIREGLQVLDAWGFEFKTFAFTWLKTRQSGVGLVIGGGSYTRANGEVCLLGVRGTPLVRRRDVPSGILSPRQAHSQKPTIARKRIVALVGDIPRIELFQWGAMPSGWDVWGHKAGQSR